MLRLLYETTPATTRPRVRRTITPGNFSAKSTTRWIMPSNHSRQEDRPPRHNPLSGRQSLDHGHGVPPSLPDPDVSRLEPEEAPGSQALLDEDHRTVAEPQNGGARHAQGSRFFQQDRDRRVHLGA